MELSLDQPGEEESSYSDPEDDENPVEDWSYSMRLKDAESMVKKDDVGGMFKNDDDGEWE